MFAAMLIYVALVAGLTAVAPPPPGCRTSVRNNATAFECVLCQSTPPKLRSNTDYFVNADCSFTARSGVVSIEPPVVATEGSTVQPLTGARVQLYGTIHVAGSNVKISNLIMSHRIQTVTSKAHNLVVSNVVVSEDSVGFSVQPPRSAHEVSLNNLNIQNLNVPQRLDNTIATLYHTVGDVSITCSSKQLDRVVIQPIVSAGTSYLPNCQVVNMSAIFDALGSSYVYDTYSMDPPEWVVQLRQWALTLTIASAVILIARYTSHPKATKTPPTFSSTPSPPASQPMVSSPFANFL